MISKRNGEWRLCEGGCFKPMTVSDRYLVFHTQDFSFKPAEAKIFITLDLIKAYNQILIAPENVLKTAVITPFVLLYMCNARFRDVICRLNLTRNECLAQIYRRHNYCVKR